MSMFFRSPACRRQAWGGGRVRFARFPRRAGPIRVCAQRGPTTRAQRQTFLTQPHARVKAGRLCLRFLRFLPFGFAQGKFRCAEFADLGSAFPAPKTRSRKKTSAKTAKTAKTVDSEPPVVLAKQ